MTNLRKILNKKKLTNPSCNENSVMHYDSRDKNDYFLSVLKTKLESAIITEDIDCLNYLFKKYKDKSKCFLLQDLSLYNMNGTNRAVTNILDLILITNSAAVLQTTYQLLDDKNEKISFIEKIIVSNNNEMLSIVMKDNLINYPVSKALLLSIEYGNDNLLEEMLKEKESITEVIVNNYEILYKKADRSLIAFAKNKEQLKLQQLLVNYLEPELIKDLLQKEMSDLGATVAYNWVNEYRMKEPMPESLLLIEDVFNKVSMPAEYFNSWKERLFNYARQSYWNIEDKSFNKFITFIDKCELDSRLSQEPNSHKTPYKIKI